MTHCRGRERQWNDPAGKAPGTAPVSQNATAPSVRPVYYQVASCRVLGGPFVYGTSARGAWLLAVSPETELSLASALPQGKPLKHHLSAPLAPLSGFPGSVKGTLSPGSPGSSLSLGEQTTLHTGSGLRRGLCGKRQKPPPPSFLL